MDVMTAIQKFAVFFLAPRRVAGSQRVDQVAVYCSDGPVLTMAAYAEQIAAGGDACWRGAVRHAAGWVGAQHPTVDLGRQVPLPQLSVQAIALLVYGMARSGDVDPAMVCARQIIEWVDERRLPMPPDLSDLPGSGDLRECADRLRLWRYEVDAAADRSARISRLCCSRLGTLCLLLGVGVWTGFLRPGDRYLVVVGRHSRG